MTKREIFKEVLELIKPILGFPEGYWGTIKKLFKSPEIIAANVQNQNYNILKPYIFLHSTIVICLLCAYFPDLFVSFPNYWQRLSKVKVDIVLCLYFLPVLFAVIFIYMYKIKGYLKQIYQLQVYYLSIVLFCIYILYLLFSIVFEAIGYQPSMSEYSRNLENFFFS